MVRNVNHKWFNRLSKEKQLEINKLFQQYKIAHQHKVCVAEVTTDGIKQVEIIPLQIIDETDYITIKLEPMTAEEMKIYQEHKRKRNERVFKKFEGWER